jgi:hypothetical protein
VRLFDDDFDTDIVSLIPRRVYTLLAAVIQLLGSVSALPGWNQVDMVLSPLGCVFPQTVSFVQMLLEYQNSGSTAKIDQEAINYSKAPTSTYYASSVAPVSKQDDQQSLYTYASDMDAQAFVKRIGDRVSPSYVFCRRYANPSP